MSFLVVLDVTQIKCVRWKEIGYPSSKQKRYTKQWSLVCSFHLFCSFLKISTWSRSVFVPMWCVLTHTHREREKEPRFNPNFNVPINLVRDPGVYSSTTSYFLPPTQSKAFLLSMAFLVLPHFALTF